MNTFSEIRIPVPWGHIAGRWYGNQLEQPVLALHGWLDNCGTFAKLAPLLMPHINLLCIDFPGHGYSSHLPPGIQYNITEFVRTVRMLVHSYQWDRITLLGHSMGASVAFRYAAIWPDSVNLIVAIDSIVKEPVPHTVYPKMLNFVVEKALENDERILNQALMNEPPSYSFEQCEQLLHVGSGKSVELDKCKYILERNISRSMKYPEKYYFSRDARIKYMVTPNSTVQESTELAMRISRVPIPYLVIKGGISDNIGEKATSLIEIMNENNPLFEMHTVLEERHHLHLNNSQLIADIIIPFMKKNHQTKNVQTHEVGERSKL